MFFETDGSMTDIDGTLERMSQGSRPPAGAQEEWRILASLASALGAPMPFAKASDVFAALTQLWKTPEPIGLNDLLQENPGAQTPQVFSSYARRRTRPAFKLHHSARPEAAGTSKTQSTSTGGLRLLWTTHAQGRITWAHARPSSMPCARVRRSNCIPRTHAALA